MLLTRKPISKGALWVGGRQFAANNVCWPPTDVGRQLAPNRRRYLATRCEAKNEDAAQGAPLPTAALFFRAPPPPPPPQRMNSLCPKGWG